MYFSRGRWLLSLTLLGFAWMTSHLVGEEPAVVEAKAEKPKLLTVEQARERAEQLQEVYVETLDVMHDHYFHEERAIVPARAMEDLFAKLERRTNVKARWISVNAKAMSVKHEPASEFEKLAAKEIAAGKETLEEVAASTDGESVYRRAVAIPLGDGCIHCHLLGALTAPPKGPRYAGLVFSIPVEKK